MHHANSIREAVAGGWQMTSIVTAQSGAPFSVFLATPTANTGTFTRPKGCATGICPPINRASANGLTLTCFVNPPPFTFGNAGRNILIGPGLFTWDLGLDKEFRVSDRFGLQFRSEFFNLLNRAKFRPAQCKYWLRLVQVRSPLWSPMPDRYSSPYVSIGRQ